MRLGSADPAPVGHAMRRDMHEVVIERPRGGMRGKLPQPAFDGRRWEADDVPERRASMSRKRGTKHFSDLIGPLHRFLISAVGRPWDDVYSEIREHLHAGTLLHVHILEHVELMVDHGRSPERAWKREFWVNRRGRLCRNARRRFEVADRRHGDRVGARRFLERRVGKPWSEVEADWAPFGLDATRWVTFEVRRRFGHRGRIHEWLPATPEREARPGEPLARGRFYIEAGTLRQVP